MRFELGESPSCPCVRHCGEVGCGHSIEFAARKGLSDGQEKEAEIRAPNYR